MPHRTRPLFNRRRVRLGLGIVLLVAVGGIAVQLVRSQWVQYLRKLSSGDIIELLPEVAQRIQDFRRVKMEGDRMAWEVAAREARYFEEDNEIVVAEPKVSFYLKEGDGVVSVSGATGRIVLNGREMDRAELEGGIEVRFRDYVVRTDRAIYDRALGTVVSPDAVSVSGDGLSFSGGRMTVEMDTQRMRLDGAVETVFRDVQREGERMLGRREVLAAVLAVLALAVPAAGAGEETSRDPFGALSGGTQNGPITITSDSLELDYREAVLTYVGSVQVTQGDMVLTSDRLAITFHQGALQGVAPTGDQEKGDRQVRDRIREIVADGSVRIEQAQRVATGQRAVFDHAKQTIVLSEDAVLEEGPNQVSGERIVVYLNEQRSVVESGSKSRVQAVLYPETVDKDALIAAEPATDPVPDAVEAPATGPAHDTLADIGSRKPSGPGDGSE